MGKSDGFLTPKAIANRIKAKGLQKLRWYCQMCQKQCRDENGFKCHTSSESHQRQMAIFSDNPHKFLDNFSAEFEESFIRHLRHRHGTKRVHANMVYAELIRDRHHLHMNATKWTSLTEFVKYLGRTGKATVDETPKGWFLAYIDRDPETIAKQKALERRKKADVDEEERERLRIEKQLEEVRRQREALDDGGEEETAATADDGDSNGDDAESRNQQQQEGEPVKLEGVKIAFSLGPSKIVKPPAPLLAKAEAEKDPHGEDDEERKQTIHKRKAEDHDRRHPHENENDDDDVEGNNVFDDKRGSRREEEEDQDEADRRREFKRPRGSRWDTTATTTASTTTTTSSGAERESSSSSSTRRPGSAAPARPLTAVEEIKLQEERRKQRLERERLERERREKEEQEKMMKEKERTKAKAKRTDYWLAEGIVVKVKHKTVGGGKYYNQKGVIEQVDGRYVGQVRMLQGGDVLRLDQEFLETVLPALEGKVLVVNGEHRGERATLKAIDVDKFCATIELRGSGELVKGVAYEDIAKLA